jgi:hypothetical protein
MRWGIVIGIVVLSGMAMGAPTCGDGWTQPFADGCSTGSGDGATLNEEVNHFSGDSHVTHLGDETALAVDDNIRLYDGENLVWNHTSDIWVDSLIFTSDYVVYAHDQRIRALNRDDGTVAWTWSNPDDEIGGLSLAIQDGDIVHTYQHNYVSSQGYYSEEAIVALSKSGQLLQEREGESSMATEYQRRLVYENGYAVQTFSDGSGLHHMDMSQTSGSTYVSPDSNVGSNDNRPIHYEDKIITHHDDGSFVVWNWSDKSDPPQEIRAVSMSIGSPNIGGFLRGGGRGMFFLVQNGNVWASNSTKIVRYDLDGTKELEMSWDNPRITGTGDGILVRNNTHVFKISQNGTVEWSDSAYTVDSDETAWAIGTGSGYVDLGAGELSRHLFVANTSIYYNEKTLVTNKVRGTKDGSDTYGVR